MIKLMVSLVKNSSWFIASVKKFKPKKEEKPVPVPQLKEEDKLNPSLWC